MKTTTSKTLADFAPEMLTTLTSITHPMASDQDLQDAIDLLNRIAAARKMASDEAFLDSVLAR